MSSLSPINFRFRVSMSKPKSAVRPAHDFTNLEGHPASLVARSSIQRLLRSSSPPWVDEMSGAEEFFDGKNRDGRSHSGTLRSRKAVAESSGGRFCPNVFSEDGRARNDVASWICLSLNPKLFSCLDSSAVADSVRAS